MSPDREGRAQAAPDALGHVQRILLVIDLGEGHEFVAAEPGHHVDTTGHGHHAIGHLVEHRVAGGVVRPIVHQFEPVEVDEQDGHRRPPTPHVAQRLVEALEEQAAVRQAGKPVVGGLEGHLLGHLAALDRQSHHVRQLVELGELLGAEVRHVGADLDGQRVGGTAGRPQGHPVTGLSADPSFAPQVGTSLSSHRGWRATTVPSGRHEGRLGGTDQRADVGQQVVGHVLGISRRHQLADGTPEGQILPAAQQDPDERRQDQSHQQEHPRDHGRPSG